LEAGSSGPLAVVALYTVADGCKALQDRGGVESCKDTSRWSGMTPAVAQAAPETAPLPDWRRAIAADIGADPGRWLDRELVESGPRHTDQTLKRAVHARIKGMRSLAVVEAWREVEHRIDRGPRDEILEWLDVKAAALEEQR
jgi:hypothetical protein